MGELELDISWNMRRVILAFGLVLAAWGPRELTVRSRSALTCT